MMTTKKLMIMPMMVASLRFTSPPRRSPASTAPPEARTRLTEERWDQWAEYLLPRAVSAGAKSKDLQRVRQVLSFAAGLIDWCYGEGFADPKQPTRVFRDSTIERYVKWLKDTDAAEGTVYSTTWALKKVTAATPTR